jgi:hypothetical protein
MRNKPSGRDTTDQIRRTENQQHSINIRLFSYSDNLPEPSNRSWKDTWPSLRSSFSVGQLLECCHKPGAVQGFKSTTEKGPVEECRVDQRG